MASMPPKIKSNPEVKHFHEAESIALEETGFAALEFCSEKAEHLLKHMGKTPLGHCFKMLAKASDSAKHYCVESAHGDDSPLTSAAIRVATDTAAVSGINVALRAAGISGAAGPLAAIMFASEVAHALDRDPKVQKSMEAASTMLDPFSKENASKSNIDRAILGEAYAQFEGGRMLFKLLGVPASGFEKLGSLAIEQAKTVGSQIKSTSSEFFSSVHDYVSNVFSAHIHKKSESEMQTHLRSMTEAERKSELDKYLSTMHFLRPFVTKLNDSVPNISTSVQDISRNLHDFTSAVFSGAAKGVIGLVDNVLHPLDNIVYPMSDLIHDATILAARNINTEGATVIDPNNPYYDLSILKQHIDKHPQLYDDAAMNMQKRLDRLKSVGPQFMQAPWTKKVEMVSELATNILVPGFFIKGVKAIKTLHSGETQLLKFKDRTRWWEERITVPREVEALSIKEVRKWTDDILMYVVNHDRQLIITPQKYDHWHLGKGKYVYAAGDVYIDSKGMISRIDNRSGSYAPQAKYLANFVEDEFIKNGYREALYKFVDHAAEMAESGYRAKPRIAKEGIVLPYAAISLVGISRHSAFKAAPGRLPETEAEKMAAHAAEMAQSPKPKSTSNNSNNSDKSKGKSMAARMEDSVDAKQRQEKNNTKPAAPIAPSAETELADAFKQAAKQLFEGLTTHAHKLQEMEKMRKETEEQKKRAEIQKRIEDEHKKHDDFIENSRSVFNAVAVGAMTFLRGENRILAQKAYSIGNDIANIAKYWNAISKSQALEQAVGLGSSIAMQNYAGIAISLFSIAQTFMQDDDAGPDPILQAINDAVIRLSQQIAAMHRDVVERLEEASKDRYLKHLQVMKCFMTLHQEQAELKKAVQKFYNETQKNHTLIHRDLRVIGNQISDFRAHMASDLEALRTEKVYELVDGCLHSIKRGLVTGNDFQGYLVQLCAKTRSVGKSVHVTGANIDFTKPSDIVMALRGTPSLQKIIYNHPIFSKINLLVNLTNAKASVKLKENFDLLSNPLVWDFCTDSFVNMIDLYLNFNSNYPPTQKVKNCDLERMAELQEQGEQILKFHDKIHTHFIIYDLMQEYSASLDALTETIESLISTYDKKLTHEATENYLKGLQKEKADLELMPMPTFNWNQYMIDFVRNNFIGNGYPNSFCFRPGGIFMVHNGYHDKWNPRVSIKFKNDTSLPEIQELRSFFKVVLGGQKKDLPPYLEKSKLYESHKEQVLAHVENRKNIYNPTLTLYGESNISATFLGKVIYPADRKQFNLLLIFPNIILPKEYLLAESMGIGQITCKYLIQDNYFILQVYYQDKNGEKLIFNRRKKCFDEYGPECNSITLQEKIYDWWYGARYPKATDTITMQGPWSYRVWKFYYPPIQHQPVEADLFLETSENLLEPDQKHLAEVQAQISASIQQERLQFNRTLDIDAACTKVDACYLVFTETLKFIYGEQILSHPLLANNDLIKHGADIRRFREQYQGDDKYLHVYINELSIKLYDFIWEIRKLTPSLPLVSTTIDKIKQCSQNYRKRKVPAIDVRDPSEVQQTNGELKLALDKISSLEAELKKREEHHSREIAGLRTEQSQTNAMMKELLGLLQGQGQAPGFMPMYARASGNAAAAVSPAIALSHSDDRIAQAGL